MIILNRRLSEKYSLHDDNMGNVSTILTPCLSDTFKGFQYMINYFWVPNSRRPYRLRNTKLGPEGEVDRKEGLGRTDVGTV